MRTLSVSRCLVIPLVRQALQGLSIRCPRAFARVADLREAQLVLADLRAPEPAAHPTDPHIRPRLRARPAAALADGPARVDYIGREAAGHLAQTHPDLDLQVFGHGLGPSLALLLAPAEHLPKDVLQANSAPTSALSEGVSMAARN